MTKKKLAIFIKLIKLTNTTILLVSEMHTHYVKLYLYFIQQEQSLISSECNRYLKKKKKFFEVMELN